jgi:hypothetical protein
MLSLSLTHKHTHTNTHKHTHVIHDAQDRAGPVSTVLPTLLTPSSSQHRYGCWEQRKTGAERGGEGQQQREGGGGGGRGGRRKTGLHKATEPQSHTLPSLQPTHLQGSQGSVARKNRRHCTGVDL